MWHGVCPLPSHRPAAVRLCANVHRVSSGMWHIQRVLVRSCMMQGRVQQVDLLSMALRAPFLPPQTINTIAPL
jgi:late competence protein required for DNA uptake (superfamily II DNA/RNA helicase)